MSIFYPSPYPQLPPKIAAVFASFPTTTSQNITGKANIISLHSMEANISLPATAGNLATIFNPTDITNVGTDDGIRVGITGIGYLIQQFKFTGANNTSNITVNWNGQTTKSPSVSTVYLQIWNYNSSTWETLASNNSASVNVDFNLQGTQSSNLSNYYDVSFVVILRVYQQN